MFHFLSKEIDGGRCDLRIDLKIFSSHIAMKAAYTFLDRAYFFFCTNEECLIVQITPKDGQSWDAEKFAFEFSDELLSTMLRDMLERDNKEIRERIVGTALTNSLDIEGFVEFDTDRKDDGMEQNKNQIDFDKDIDEILREIENDPELKIDEEEIERILREIEEETKDLEIPKPEITLNTNAIKDVKSKFQNRK